MQNIDGNKGAGFLFVLFLFFFNPVPAQIGTVRGLIRDTGDRPLPYADVLLLKYPDSSMIRGTVSDSLGKFVFVRIPEGKYLMGVTLTGFEQAFTGTFVINAENPEIDLRYLHLSLANRQLKEVTVSARKPMFEQKADRTIINVKNNITSAGGSALEVLEKSPGVTVSRQDNSIAIYGKTGVSVMINGKISYMPAGALIQFLSGINAGNIERIELITVPPSKYDAGGNGGYINIVLINNPYSGFNGSYFLTAGFGLRPLGAAGMNFNLREGKINFYGNYSFKYDHTIQTSTAFTRFMRSGNQIEDGSNSYRDAITQVHNIRMGLDYQLDNSTIVGVLISGYSSKWSMVAENGSTISINHLPDTIITMKDDPEINLWQNISTNINYQHLFRPGNIIYFDINYIYYKDHNPNTYSTDYFDQQNKFLYHENSRGDKTTPIHFQVYSIDYKTPFGKKVTLEAGLKWTLSDFTNEVSVDDFRQGVWNPVPDLTAKYMLKENISAAYGSFSINPDNRTTLSGGLRYEYTSSNLGTKETANLISRKYGELFPTFYISHKINADNQFSFSYNRRISRPTFNDLAPFTIFFDPKTYYSGNPTLQPAIANTVQAAYGFRKYNFTISYTYETNTIDNFYFQPQRMDTLNNILYLSARNFDDEHYLNAAFSLPITLSRWWTMQYNISMNWVRINTAFEKIPVLLNNINYSLNSIQRFTLPGEFAIELSGFYTSASYVGTSKRKPFYQVDLGLQKKIGKKKDILRFTAGDIFNSGR